MIGGTVSLASAQEATPDPDEADTEEVADPDEIEGDTNPFPSVGESVPYIAESGQEVATVTVTEVVRGWGGYSEFSEPAVGSEYVGFVIEVESTTPTGAIEVNDFDFLLQDTAGFFGGTSFVSIDEDNPPDPAPLDDPVQLAGGETIEFVVVFEAFEGAELANIFWQPESGRLITLAQLEGE